MSTAAIIVPVKLSFYERIKLRIVAFCKAEPQWAAIAIAALTIVTPLVGTVLTLVAPEDVAIMAGVVGAIEADLAGLTEIIKESGGDAPSVSAFATAITGNLGKLEAMAGIKDAETQTKIATIVATVTAEIKAIQTNFSAAAVEV